MKSHPPISDSGLLLGSVFVAVSIVGIGILGNQQVPQQMATAQPIAMTATAGTASASGGVGASASGNASANTTGATSKQKCIQLQPNQTAASVDTKCIDGCQYIVMPGNFPSHASVTAKSEYSDGSNNAGTVQFTLTGQSSLKTLICKQGSAGTLGTAAGTGDSAGYSVRGLVGSDPNSLNVVQPAAATPAAQTSAPAATTPQTSAPAGTPSSGSAGTTANSGQYSSTNLPNQQGCYPTSGGTLCYTPNMPGPNLNGSAGYSQVQIFNSPSTGNDGTVPPAAGGAAVTTASPNTTNGFEGYTVGQIEQAQQLGQYAAQGTGFGGDSAQQLYQAQQLGQYSAQGNGFNGNTVPPPVPNNPPPGTIPPQDDLNYTQDSYVLQSGLPPNSDCVPTDSNNNCSIVFSDLEDPNMVSINPSSEGDVGRQFEYTDSGTGQYGMIPSNSPIPLGAPQTYQPPLEANPVPNPISPQQTSAPPVTLPTPPLQPQNQFAQQNNLPVYTANGEGAFTMSQSGVQQSFSNVPCTTAVQTYWLNWYGQTINRPSC